jgi:osmotically-inducible protein OsmY
MAQVGETDLRPDAAVSTEIRSRYYEDDALRGHRIDVRVNDGLVALEGAVTDDAARQRAVSLARGVEGVRDIENRIELRPGTPTADVAHGPAETDISASWITTKIQATYFADPTIKARQVDVTTTDTGIVTLEGQVDSEQASARAADIARATDGVRRVDNQLRVVVETTTDGSQALRREGAPADVDVSRRDVAPVDDGWVTMKIQSKYFLDGDVADRRIDVDTQNGVVTLSGEVRTEGERRQAVALARNTDGVQSVTDQLRLVPATDDGPEAERTDARRTPADVVDDTWLTTKIQSKYFLEDDVKARDIDVTTRDGVVTLSGAVESDAARRTAEAIAEETDGVTRVVNRLRIAAVDGDVDDTVDANEADAAARR